MRLVLRLGPPATPDGDTEPIGVDEANEIELLLGRRREPVCERAIIAAELDKLAAKFAKIPLR